MRVVLHVRLSTHLDHHYNAGMGTLVNLHSKMYALWFPLDEPPQVYEALRQGTARFVFHRDDGNYIDILNLNGIRRWTLIQSDQWPVINVNDLIVCTVVVDSDGAFQIEAADDPGALFDEYME